MNETTLVRHIMLAVSDAKTRIFRNNTGQAWQGRKVERRGNDVLIRDARPVRFGLCEGSSDLIGWTPVTITPDMVGKTMAVFTAIEVKGKRGRTTDAQNRFLLAVRQAGGMSGVARENKDALDICSQY